MAKKTNSSINGSEYFRVRAKVGTDNDGKPIMKSFYGSSKKEAELKRNEYIDSINKGLMVDFDKIQFSTLFLEWFEETKRPTISLTSYVRYEATFRIHIKPSNVFNMKLLEIRSIHIQKMINALPSPNIAERVYLLLASFFKYCIEEQYIVRSPLMTVKLPKIVRKEKKEFLERDEISKLSYLSQENFIFTFAAFTGMRQGEILALSHSDIDLKKGLINVDKSVIRVTCIENGKRISKTVVNSPKTKSGIRTIPIMDELIEPLKKQIASEKAKHLKRGVKYYKSALLFSSKNLTHKRGDHVLEEWKKIQKGLFDENITFHALRHTFCTMLCDQGVPTTVAADLMGHSNTETVTKIYAHMMKESPREAISTLSSYYKKA